MSKRILFVEDDYMTVTSAVTHLEILGHEVKVVDTAEDAVEALMWDEYEVVFLDVMLPPGEVFSLEETSDGRYTGLRLLELVRTDDRYSKNSATRIAVITNWREEPQVDTIVREQRATLLEKPISLATIEGFVNS